MAREQTNGSVERTLASEALALAFSDMALRSEWKRLRLGSL